MTLKIIGEIAKDVLLKIAEEEAEMERRVKAFEAAAKTHSAPEKPQ